MDTPTPGLAADWLNGWLAALGVTVLVPEARLSWTATGSPHAVLRTPDDLMDMLVEAWPTGDDLAGMAIARAHPQANNELGRNVPFSAYRERARSARTDGDWTLSSTLTDLGRDDGKDMADHSPFDPPGPGTVGTVHDRLVRCHGLIDPEQLQQRLTETLAGRGKRVKANGLGFDHRRLSASADASGQYVDPVAEVLAFQGLAMFPVRGTGARAETRGWSGPASRRGSFTWPVWTPFLDRWGIDGLIDRFHTHRRQTRSLGLQAAYASVPYAPKAVAERTRAYASERIL
jgi:hypothetical protein